MKEHSCGCACYDMKLCDCGYQEERDIKEANQKHDQFTEYLKERCEGLSKVVFDAEYQHRWYRGRLSHSEYIANAIRKHLGVTDD